MRLQGAWLLGLLLSALAGCTGAESVRSLIPRTRNYWPSLGPSALQIEMALIKQPLGCSYINVDLWREVDEQILPFEKRAVLEANGYRVGIISGNTPAELQRLLTSDESCIEARRIVIKKDFQPLAPGERLAALKVVQDGESLALDFERAEFGLGLHLARGEDNEVIVQFEPRVRHGDAMRLMKPAEDRSDWALRTGRPEEAYPRLAWEVALGPEEYVIIGGLLQRQQTLGHHGFVAGAGETPAQYLLVIRACNPQSPQPPIGSPTQTSSGPKGPPPLAQQSITSTRLPVSPANRGQSQ